MRCILCVIIDSIPEESRVAFAAFVPSDENTLRYYVGMILDSVKKPDHSVLAKAARRGTLITERCAQLIEKRCGTCGEDTCITCDLARDIRINSDAIYADRDLELEGDTMDKITDDFIANVCDEHKIFGDLLREEQCRRQTWELALQLEKGARK